MENVLSKKIIQENLKKKILIYFTLMLIKNSKSKEIANLKKVIEKKEDTKESEKDFEHVFGDMLNKIEILKQIQLRNNLKIAMNNQLNRNKYINNQLNNQIPKSTQNPQSISKGRDYKLKKRFLDIPDISLPSHLNYLKPVPERINLNFYKLNPLINDPKVREIVANPNDNVIVKGSMGVMPSIIYLTKEDIMSVITLFSRYSKIPLNEGIYKVVLGDLILSAYIDRKNQDFRFKIRKMI
ncbi:hypothetical protein GYA25_01390 [Candidatus Woesearchaeota archaeon]|nr:hypothetical protein [Candidatus Woesearchaeota archaeon]